MKRREPDVSEQAAGRLKRFVLWKGQILPTEDLPMGSGTAVVDRASSHAVRRYRVA